MTNTAKVLLALFGTAALGAAGYGVYVLVTEREPAKGEVAHRSALPKMELKLPETAADHEALDNYLDDCIGRTDLILTADLPEEDIQAAVDELRECVAADYYPDVAWPPVIGDHPSIFQAWSLIRSKVDTKVRENLDLPPVTPGETEVEPPVPEPAMPPPLGSAIDEFVLEGVRVDSPLLQLMSGNAQITVLGSNLGDPATGDATVYLEPVDATDATVLVAEAELMPDGIAVLLEPVEASYTPYGAREHRVWYTEPGEEPIEVGVIEFPVSQKQFVPATPGGGPPMGFQS